MTGLTVFQYQEQQIRTVEKDGEHWWVAKDVCAVFGEKNHHRAVGKLDDDEKGVTQIDTPGGRQSATIVNEPGLYSLLFVMQPTKARGVSKEYIEERQAQLKAFKRWITHEVIPAIRKTGHYGAQEPADGLRALAEEVRRLSERIDAMAPKRPALPSASIDLSDANKRRWMRQLNARLDIIEERCRYEYSRNHLLHIIYDELQSRTGVILDLERFRCIEERNLDNCSTIEAIYYTPHLRQKVEQLIDDVMHIEHTDW